MSDASRSEYLVGPPATAASLPVDASASSGWGIILLIGTEAVLFACLAAAYFFLRSHAPTWPPNGVKLPELLLPAINTVLLVSSSLTMIWAERGVKRGRPGQLRLGLIFTFILGAVFLGVQLFEYSRAEFAPSDNVYSSLFFALTGLHTFHVLVGVLAILSVLVWAFAGYFTERRHKAVHNVALYWHFVDAVWLILIIPTIYLSPYLR